MQVGCWSLFKVFSHMSLLGFGGVLPFAYRHLVERTQWLTAEEFAQTLGIAQLLPGPTVCNLSVMVGQRYAGVAGGFSALAGMLLGPFFIVIGLGMAYQELAGHPMFVAAMRGMAAAAAGLILATAFKLARGMLRGTAPGARRAVQVLLLAAAFAGLGVAKIGLLAVVCTLVPIGFLLFAFVWRKP